MNAIQFLISEHNKVRLALAEIENPVNSFETRRKLFEKLSHEIIAHEKVEEKKWYPHFSDILDSRVNHLVNDAKYAANEIEKFKHISDEKAWNDKFVNFKKAVEHHAAEEEIKLFPVVEQLLDQDQLDKIGVELMEYKNYLINESSI